MGLLDKVRDTLRSHANPVNLVRDIHDSSVGRTLQNHLNPANVFRDLHHTRLAEFAKQGVRNFGHDVSAEWKGEGMFGGRVLKGFPLGLGSRTGRRNALFLAAIGTGAGLASGAGGGGAGASAGSGAGASAGTAGWVDPFMVGGGIGSGTAGLPVLGEAAGSSGSGILAKLFGGGGGEVGGNFWKNTLINSGINLVGGQLQNMAQAKADKANREAIEDRIRRALAALSPEHIMALAQQFLPQMAANMSQAGQTAIQAVRSQAARTGQLEGPRALNYEAGTRAKLAGDVQAAAQERAFQDAFGQVGAITGMPVPMQQPRMGYADALTNSANQAYFARAMSQRPQNPTLPYNYGFNNNMSPGGPDVWDRVQTEGTPYQWPFYGR